MMEYLFQIVSEIFIDDGDIMITQEYPSLTDSMDLDMGDVNENILSMLYF